MVRTEYIAWSQEVELDYYQQTKQLQHLNKAKNQFQILKKYTNKQGGLQMTDTDTRVWIGENGLAAWQALRLYKITKEQQYYTQAIKWINHITKNPPTQNKKEPRLHAVFIAWCNYAFIELSTINKEWQPTTKQYCQKLLQLQKNNKLWTICYHYDLYVARHLLHAYHHFKHTDNPFATKLYLSVKQFMQKTRYTKIPIVNTRPIHYLFFDWKGSGYSTQQYARLCYKMYQTSYDIDDYLEGTIALNATTKHLTKNRMVLKQVTDKKGNHLATSWNKHIHLLQKQCEKHIKKWI